MKMEYLDKLIEKYENIRIELEKTLRAYPNHFVVHRDAEKYLRTVDTIIAELKELRTRL